MIGAMVKAAMNGYVERLRFAAIRGYHTRGQFAAPEPPLIQSVESALARDSFTRYLRQFDSNNVIGKGCNDNCVLGEYFKQAMPNVASVSVDYNTVTFLAKTAEGFAQYQFRLPFWASTISHLNDGGHWVTARRVRNWNMFIPGYRCVPDTVSAFEEPASQDAASSARQILAEVALEEEVVLAVHGETVLEAVIQVVHEDAGRVVQVTFSQPNVGGMMRPAPMMVRMEANTPSAPSFVPNYKTIEELYESAQAPYAD